MAGGSLAFWFLPLEISRRLNGRPLSFFLSFSLHVPSNLSLTFIVGQSWIRSWNGRRVHLNGWVCVSWLRASASSSKFTMPHPQSTRLAIQLLLPNKKPI